MITKLASSYFTGVSEVFTSRSVKGFRSAILTVNAAEGESFQICAYQTFDGTVPTSQNQRAYFYKDGVKQEGNVTINTGGTYTYIIDFDGATNLKIAYTGDATNSVFSLNLKQEKYDNAVDSALMGIKTTEDAILQESQTKGYDVFSEYSWGTNVDVHRYNSAKLIVLGIESSIGITCTANPQNDAPSELNYNPDMYYGAFTVNTMTSAVNEVKIDISDASRLKFNAINTSGQTLSVYLLLSERGLEIDEEKQINPIHQLIIGTKAIKSVVMNLTIDGIAENKDYAKFNIKTANNSQIKYVIDNVLVNQSTYFNSAGTYRVLVNLSDINDLVPYVYDSTGYTITVVPFDNVVDYSMFSQNSFSLSSGDYEFEDIKQIEFDINGVEGDRVYLYGSNDRFKTSEQIPFVNTIANTTVAGNKYLDSELTTCFANVENYKYVRIRYAKKARTNQTYYIYGEALSTINIRPYKEYKDALTLTYLGNTKRPWLRGYKYAKVKFKDSVILNGVESVSTVKDCTLDIKFRDLTIPIKYYNLGLEPIPESFYSYAGTKGAIWAKPVGGGFVMEFESPLNIDTACVINVYASKTGYIATPAFEVTYYTDKPEPEGTGIKKIYEKADYSVYQLPSDSTNRDVLNDDILEWTDNTLYFWHGGYLGIKYEIPFGADNVKNYVEGETINFAYLLPFAGNKKRSDGVSSLLNPSRIVVFTNSRVYHNFPQRETSTGSDIITSDMQIFDESSIITRKKWQPVNDKTKIDSKHKYLPVLAEYDYNQFDGRVSGTTGFVDTYSNGGLVNYNNRLWLDIPIDGVAYWNRLTYANMTKGEKWCVFGNYNTIPGSEPLVMATNDGGRTWHVKAYFGCTDFYGGMYGSKVDLKPITDVAAYVSGSLRMCRRRFNVPTPETKEPSVPFVIEAEDKSLVTSFTTDADGDVLVTLEDNVDYDGKYPVVYFENVSANSEWDYICNTGFTADGTTTNSGIFFRVEKVTANTYKLFGDLGNQYEGDMVCRHVHAVNAVESGFLISTGESYCPDYFEGGFIYHLEQNEKNGTSIISPAEVNNKVLRLCSSYMGVNRASGAYLFSDNYDPTLLYVSDEAFTVGGAPIKTEKRYASIPGRTDKIPITPGGIFVGKLSDIDDQSKFNCVCELHTTIISLVQTHGHFAADGHSNAIMFSKDGFNWDIDVYDGSQVNGTDNYGNIYFGNKVAVFK